MSLRRKSPDLEPIPDNKVFGYNVEVFRFREATAVVGTNPTTKD